ncbi:hypothetical protein [Alcanivorax sp. 1008]|uniref:hypothetical protein n=1 Tax=Alcanivorax sp. 1008 TaxID=2816853 RepID=UPI001DAA100E|nr:hypothetical protein [Alcanivorax sp. 1008]MCC1497625.1 hypothetical protein [Alcanivorax sp. 1008]
MSKPNNRITARYCPINRISPADVLKMYGIFQNYYENSDLDTFVSDMSRKTGVFMLRRRSDQKIVGFSTVATMDMQVDGKRIKGVFSGDTIIEREYWGTRALPLAFFLYLVRTILRHPMTPVFWLLISKGYKTYLLMANNLFRFYPHPQNRYQEYQSLIPQYCEQLFPGYYDADRGVLDFGDSYQRLKDDVAPITDQVRQASAAAAYFETCNPEWHRGTELPCVGRIGFSDAFRYVFRYLNKVWRKPSQGAVHPAAQPVEAADRGNHVPRVAVAVRVISASRKKKNSNGQAMVRSRQ